MASRGIAFVGAGVLLLMKHKYDKIRKQIKEELIRTNPYYKELAEKDNNYQQFFPTNRKKKKKKKKSIDKRREYANINHDTIINGKSNKNKPHKKELSPKERYKLFLKSAYWFKVRKLVLIRDNRACCKCGAKKRLQAHHTTYKNHKNELEHLEDLITLCRDCHKKEHGID